MQAEVQGGGELGVVQVRWQGWEGRTDGRQTDGRRCSGTLCGLRTGVREVEPWSQEGF